MHCIDVDVHQARQSRHAISVVLDDLTAKAACPLLTVALTGGRTARWPDFARPAPPAATSCAERRKPQGRPRTRVTVTAYRGTRIYS
eukprot:6209074-Pleurochrysis_carterae.AAC.3